MSTELVYRTFYNKDSFELIFNYFSMESKIVEILYLNNKTEKIEVDKITSFSNIKWVSFLATIYINTDLSSAIQKYMNMINKISNYFKEREIYIYKENKELLDAVENPNSYYKDSNEFLKYVSPYVSKYINKMNNSDSEKEIYGNLWVSLQNFVYKEKITVTDYIHMEIHDNFLSVELWSYNNFLFSESIELRKEIIYILEKFNGFFGCLYSEAWDDIHVFFAGKELKKEFRVLEAVDIIDFVENFISK